MSRFFLETDRLILTPTTPSVARRRLLCPSFSEIIPVGERTMMVKFPREWPGDAIVFFPDLAKLSAIPDDWGGTLIEKKTRTAVGGIGCKGKPDENGRIEIGYGVNESARGQGFCTEVTVALTDWLLARPDVSVVAADCLDNNLSSIRVLEKCGFARVDARYDEGEGGNLLLWERAKT